MAPLPLPGSVGGAVVTVECPPGAVPGSGYLKVKLGEKLELLHIGAGKDERGWLYAQQATPPHQSGWLPTSAVLPVRAGAETADAVALAGTTTVTDINVVCASRPVAGWLTGRTDSGYLAPIKKGEELVVLHEGAVGTDEEGWAYMRRSAMPYDAGWVCMDVLIGDHENSDDEDNRDEEGLVAPLVATPAPETRAPLEPPQPSPGDVVYHFRPRGAASQLREEPNGALATNAPALKHNGRACLISISGSWARVEFEVPDGGIAAGWLRTQYLRTAPLPPGPPPAPAASTHSTMVQTATDATPTTDLASLPVPASATEEDTLQADEQGKDAFKRVSFACGGDES